MSVLRAFVVVALSAVVLLIGGVPVLQSYATAYTGYSAGSLATSPERQKSVVDVGSPAYRAGIRTGDTVGCTNMRDGAILFPVYQVAAYEPSPIEACVIRSGNIRHVTFVARPGPPVESTYGTFGFAALRFVIFATFVIVGSILVLARPSIMTWLFYGYCIGSAPLGVVNAAWTSWPPAVFALVMSVYGTIGFLGAAFLLLFALLVPDDRPPRGWRAWVYAAGWILTIVLGVTQFYWRIQSSTPVLTITDPFVLVTSQALTLVVVLVTIARLITMSGEMRARFAWVAFGIIFGVVANYIRIYVGSAPGNIFGLLTIVTPLALMYAILRRHVIDVRFVISRAVVFGVITTAVIGIIAAVDWATSEYLKQMRVALAIDAVITIVLGVTLHRTYGTIENLVDFYIYRKKHEAEKYLKRLARTLLSSEREETVDNAVVADPYEKLDLTMAALFRYADGGFVPRRASGWTIVQDLRFDHDHDLIRFLTTERRRVNIGDLKNDVTARFSACGAAPVVAIPIFDGNDLFGFTVYGLHRDGTKLDPDEADALETLCETAAQAYIRVENLQYRSLASNARPRRVT